MVLKDLYGHSMSTSLVFPPRTSLTLAKTGKNRVQWPPGEKWAYTKWPPGDGKYYCLVQVIVSNFKKVRGFRYRNTGRSDFGKPRHWTVQNSMLDPNFTKSYVGDRWSPTYSHKCDRKAIFTISPRICREYEVHVPDVRIPTSHD